MLLADEGEIPNLLVVDPERGTLVELDLTEDTFYKYPLTLDNPVGVAMDIANDYLFITDIQREILVRTKIDGTEAVIIAKFHNALIESKVHGVAVDPTDEWVYVTDWGRGVIEGMTYDGEDRTMMVATGLDKPAGIVIDSENNYMYWTDFGTSPKIEKMQLDGTARRTVVRHGSETLSHMVLPSGLALDATEQRLYWCDAGTDRVETVRTDGTGRIILGITREDSHFLGVALYGDYIYVTDRMSRYLRRLPKSIDIDILLNLGHIDVYGVPAFKKATGILAYHRCVTAGCEVKHASGTSSTSAFPPSGHKSQNYQSEARGGSIAVSTVAVLDADLNKVVQYDFVPTATDFSLIGRPREDSWSSLMSEERTISEFTALAVDPTVDIYFYASPDSHQLFTENSTSLGVCRKTNHVSATFEPAGVAVDSVRQHIYITDRKRKVVERMTYQCYDDTVLVATGLDSPFAITVDPLNNNIFWTDVGQKPKIESGKLDGTKRKVLVASGLKSPTGLVLDQTGDVLYWCDRNLVESIQTDGTHRKMLVKKDSANFFGITLLGDYFYVTNKNSKYIQRIRKTGGFVENFGSPLFTNPTGITVFKQLPYQPGHDEL